MDVNGDGQVTVLDLAIVALFYGTQVPDGISLPADVNADGTVDITDLVTVAQAIDAADNNGGTLTADDVDAVLEVVVAQVNVIEAIAEAPERFSISRHARLFRCRLSKCRCCVRGCKAPHPPTMPVSASGCPCFKELLHRLTEMREIPETTALLPNYPNPFNPETWIPYHLSKDAEVILTIYDVRGILVRALTLGHQAAGVYESRARAAYWDGRNQIGEKVGKWALFLYPYGRQL